MENKTILITGGAGFIGSHVVRLFVKKYPHYHIVNLDKLTYAGNLENLKDVEGAPNYTFVKGDIVDAGFLHALFQKYAFDGVIHLAAESHVDRSILNPIDFVMTNVVGTVNLLNAARHAWEGRYEGKRFYHVSTDEVYGSLENPDEFFTESTPYDPRSPYSASKASSDHFVRAYHNTYGLPVVLSNCSNNYGPNQFPEKLIPLMIAKALNNEKLPVYGDGMNIRDWLYVEDHCSAICKVLEFGKFGEIYNIGGNNEWHNIDIVRLILNKLNKSEDLILFVKDRPGHDRRYAIDSTKIKNELNWEPKHKFEDGIDKTIKWYIENQNWWKKVMSGEYLKYYELNYSQKIV